MEKTKIQISPVRKIKDMMTVWSEPGPEVDVVMDLQNLTFRPGSISEIYAFHVVDHLFPEQGIRAIKNWNECLSVEGKLHLLNDNFEYICRAFIGGEISIDLYNDIHNHPCQLTRDNLIAMLKKGQFIEDGMVFWIEGAPAGMPKQHFEFILTATKKQ